MSEAKHTPGPWDLFRASPETDRDERLIVTAKDHEEEICGIVMNEADASLISAAPDLLDACRVVTAYLDRLEANRILGPELGAIRRRIHAPLRAALNPAIAKAEGR